MLKISDNSLFARLLRAPWWVSIVVAVVVTAGMFVLLPNDLKAAAVLSGVPFVAIGFIAAWKQRNTLSPTQINAALESLASMNSKAFIDALAAAYERNGYQVKRAHQTGADLAIEKQGYITLVNCKRWKAANHGVEALRELHAAMEKAETGRGVYVAVNAVSEAAAEFARNNGVRVLSGGELASQLGKR